MLGNKRPLCWEQYNMYTDAWKQTTFVLRTIQYLHRCLETKDPLCYLDNEWRHTFQTFHTFYWVPKLRQNRSFPSTTVPTKFLTWHSIFLNNQFKSDFWIMISLKNVSKDWFSQFILYRRNNVSKMYQLFQRWHCRYSNWFK